ncbi:MAG: EamA family transporter [Balneolaceae bacterium]
MKNIILFITPSLIWGSTWYVITFQVGDVDPLFSVSYRFALAGLLMLFILKVMKYNLSFSRKEHGFILLQGLLIFGFNYWMMYSSELFLTSGLVGLIFSLLVFLNILNGRIFLKTPFELKVIVGGLLGIIGTGMIFQEDLAQFTFSDKKLWGLALAVGGTYIASLGNITSARNQKAGIPVIQSNAFGMFYGALAMFTIAIFSGKTPTFEMTYEYTFSLLYLAIFGSIIAFGAYLTLVGNIGASKAAYVSLIAPVIALTISTFLEGYEWTIVGFAGAALIIVGNVVALRFSRKDSLKST